jgi:uncharacterized protein (TIGR02145 family)
MLKAGKYGEFLDVRDNQVYKTIQIGSQLWTAQNMNYDMTGGFCSSDNCNTYGRFYNWDASVKACPTGWHLPSRDEWMTMMTFVTKDSTNLDSAGTKLRSLIGWSGNSTDEVGFSALSAGSMRSASGDISFAGVHVGFWTSTENAKDDSKASLLFTDYRDTGAGFADDEPKYRGFSVRCVKD